MMGRERTGPRDARALVQEALALRAWAIAILARATAAGSPPTAPHVSPDAWRLFLRAECCALELAARVDGSGVALPPDAAAILGAERHASLARVLSARAQLARIDAAFARLDPPPAHPPLLLKGGVLVALGDAPADLSDIDLLPGPGDFDALASALEAEGYAAGPDCALHLKFTAPGMLPVELHHSLTGGRPPSAAGEATVPIPGFRALHRMASVPYLVFAIEHAVVSHPHRRGHLRDATLIAAAASRCPADELHAVRAALRVTYGGAACEDMLDFCLALGTARDATAGNLRDPYRRVAALKYAIVVGPKGKVANEFASRLTMGPDVAGEFLRRYLSTVRRGTRLHPEWLARRAPRLAAAFELCARFPVRAVRVGRGVLRAVTLNALAER